MSDSQKWDVVIKPKNGWFDLDLKGILQYRDLIVLLVKRNFTLLYKQTLLGPAWVFLQPLLTTVIFTVVFGNLAQLPTDGLPKFLFYMSGNICWQFFAHCVTNTSTTFINNRNIFGKVYFPRLCIPIATVFSELINFLVQFVLFLIFVAYYAITTDAVNPDWRLILLTPLILAQLGMLGLGFGIIISALTTKYRDLQMLVSFGVQLWMYATPITYSSAMIYSRIRHWMWLYMLNPISPLIELFRAAYLGGHKYPWGYNMLSLGVTFLALMGGILLFSRIEKTFMDTI